MHYKALRDNRFCSRDVITAMLLDENKRFLISFFCSSTSNIDICIPRDWLQTTHNMIPTKKKDGQHS